MRPRSRAAVRTRSCCRSRNAGTTSSSAGGGRADRLVWAVRQQIVPLVARQVAPDGTARVALPRAYVGRPLDRVFEHVDEQPAVRLEDPERDVARIRAERVSHALAGREVPD